MNSNFKITIDTVNEHLEQLGYTQDAIPEEMMDDFIS